MQAICKVPVIFSKRLNPFFIREVMQALIRLALTAGACYVRR